MWLGPVCWGYKSGLANDVVPPTYGAFSYRGGGRMPPSIRGASYMMWEDEALYPQHTGPSHIGEEEKCLFIHGASYI